MHTNNRKGVVNIINFIRGVEPRLECDVDLIEPVVRQMELAKLHQVPVTWLIQYDAMCDPSFIEVLKNIQPQDEIGIWLEFVQPLVEKAGLTWRGRYPWDWHVNVGFSVGYSPEERARMIDIFLEDFQVTFGFAPKAAGSWFIDAYSLAHLEKKHGIVAFCNCKDQWGTDGYTLWGGYFNQAYYPSRLNSFIPAQEKEQQIGIPVFRMLGSDPIHQYEIELGTGSNGGQAVLTLESISPGGGDPAWTDRFLKNMFETPCLSFGYTQVGQENSFGWPAMSKGLIYQHQRIAKLRDQGLVRIETLSQSGKWFKATYGITPPSAVVVDQDLNEPNRGTVWYCSKNYRTNLLWDGHELRFRDIQLFDARREEPFLRSVCRESACKYDALPVLDGFLWGGKAVKAGIRIINSDSSAYVLKAPPRVSESGREVLVVCIDDRFVLTFEEGSIELRGNMGDDWSLVASWASDADSSFLGVSDQRLQFCYENYCYSVKIKAGIAAACGAGFILKPDASGVVHLDMSNR